jgi:hypothetical protein
MDGDPNESLNPTVVMFGANVSIENVTCVMESLCWDILWQWYSIWRSTLFFFFFFFGDACGRSLWDVDEST